MAPLNRGNRFLSSPRRLLRGAKKGILALDMCQRVGESDRQVRRTIVVTQEEAGGFLLDLLVTRFTYLDRDRWQAEIDSGRLLLGGSPCGGGETLAAGDRITWLPPLRPEPPVNREVRILCREGDLLFLDKPPDLPCHPGGIYLHNTLWGWLRETLGDVRFSLVNRLDRETSGIVAVALSKEAASLAFHLMAERRVIKDYRVLVEGSFPDTLDARGWLRPDGDSPIRKKRLFVSDPEAVEPEPSEKGHVTGNRDYSHTRFSLLERRHDGTSLLSAELFTGRTHQIRATLHSLGFPVAGDKLYGRDPEIFLRFPLGTMTDADRALLRLPRQALHCLRMVFPLPGGQIIDVRSLPREVWGLTSREGKTDNGVLP